MYVCVRLVHTDTLSAHVSLYFSFGQIERERRVQQQIGGHRMSNHTLCAISALLSLSMCVYAYIEIERIATHQKDGRGRVAVRMHSFSPPISNGLLNTCACAHMCE